MSFAELPSGRRNPQAAIVVVIAAILAVLFFSRSICGWMIDYFWWGEMGQVPTWIRMTGYRYLPGLAAWVIVFAVLWVAHARGMKHAGERLGAHTAYARLSTVAVAVVSLIIALATVEGWTIARYVGGQGVGAATWSDPVFQKPLSFYFFELPFYRMLLGFVATVAFAGGLVYYLAARGWQLRRDMPGFVLGQEIDLSDLRRLGRLETGLLKGLGALFLVAVAAQFWLGRYELLLSDHGNLMVGIDYLQQNLGLPLQMAKAGAAVLAAILVLAGRRKWAMGCAAVLVVDWVLPPLVGSLYVRPNELMLEKPYIVRHIETTRAAYGLDQRARTVDFAAQKEGRIDFAENKTLLENVRLWDWRAFHDTLSQSQPLRPYTYVDTDVDRYQIDGKLRQTLLAPREMDLNQLGDARSRWINRALTFTHGYGFAMAEANRISEAGLPELLVRDAPAVVRTKSLKVARPEIYYGETMDQTVFVRTAQPEFNYPSGSSEVNTRYEGKGGFPMSSLRARTVAALAEGDWNILLTNALTPESRMMIRRRVSERVAALAPFLEWDDDPYLVNTEEGRLVWIIDGYTTSNSHPYSRSVSMQNLGRFNYIRNSIKAVVDAYDGDVHLYVFDGEDPLIRAYQHLFPELFSPASAMSAGLRAHARAPEMLFRVQAEIYRTYHMRDPESYYNRADLWDLATFTTGAQGQPEPVPPTYMVAELPGEKEPEFLLMTQFTPRNKQNLIGLMAARSDGAHLGELVFLQLPKQEVIQGPLQVEALINQDQNISKDLTLWNQQGSQVLRSQMLTLPIDQTFLYVAPIYIQAAQARMPQLKKVALVRGNTLIYADTYDQALAELQAAQGGKQVQVLTPPSSPGQPVTPASTPVSDPRIDNVRAHLQRYRELMGQGKWAEAGKELEAVESAVRK
ncbi:MAG: UPF0182 family protein [Bryobacterales bacterium]|nr:UPF0182 family protein [Bryobacterales bacterium]